MSRIPHIVHSRENRRKQLRGTSQRGMAFAFALLISLSLLAFSAALVITYAKISQDLPSPDMLPALLDPEQGSLLQPTRIVARDGEKVLWTFENPLIEKRANAVLDLSQSALRSDIPPQVVKTTLASTDVDYFSQGIAHLLPWREREAIPRSLVSELLMWDRPDGPMREIREGILANQLITRYGREQVLEWYLNSAYYGRQTYGIGSAARVYFGKHVSQLNLAEAAVLAVVSEAPALNPLDAPEAARERQMDLLRRMEEKGLITEEERERALDFELAFNENGPPPSVSRPEFVEVVLDQLEDEIPRDRLLRGGYKVTTSIDGSLQAQIQCTVESGLARYRGEDEALEEGCPAARLLPTYSGLRLSGDEPLGMDIVQLDPRNGQIVAMVGAHQGELIDPFTPRPPGSLLTPYIYLTAFAQGYEPAALVWDVPLENEGLSAKDVHPGCTDVCDYHGPVSIRYAMANDYLVPAVMFWDNFRAVEIENTLSQMGIDLSDTPCSACQLFPGSRPVNLLDVAHSFGVFGQGGVLRGWPSTGENGRLDPVIVLKVEDYAGKVWRGNPRLYSRSVISKQLAYLVTHVLSDRQARQQSMGQQNVFEIGRPVAVKRGYTYQGKGAWTVGYTPQLVTAVWAGGTDSGDQGQGSVYPKLSSGIWRALTQSALKGQPVLNWEQPPGMTSLEVCLPSGLLPTEYCPETVREIFVEGNQPTQRDNLYQRVEVNRETGRLATVFTLPELIEERTYLNVPPKAREWAQEEGISTPPREYDVASGGSSPSKVSISTPDNFAFLKGSVVVKGTVPEDGLVSYQVQIGKGLNPKTWRQIGEERQTPVQGGRLVTWDTKEMEDGLYALQLVVVREGQQVGKASVLVSVDNTPPTIRVLDELDGRQYTYRRGEEILIRAQAVDNAVIDEVKFYIDRRLVATREAQPYVFPWEMEIGTFDLRVYVYDKAGNSDHQRATFEVVR